MENSPNLVTLLSFFLFEIHDESSLDWRTHLERRRQKITHTHMYIFYIQSYVCMYSFGDLGMFCRIDIHMYVPTFM
jgi:hypothetical protein